MLLPQENDTFAFPTKAFESAKALVRTLYHEKVHVNQFKLFGAEYVMNNQQEFEQQAYKAEEEFINRLKKEGKL